MEKLEACESRCEKQRTFNISALYRPPAPNINNFIEDFGNYIRQHCMKQNEIIIENLNVNILEETNINTIYLNILYEKGFISCINEYTRSQQNSRSCIDHIFIKTKINPAKMIPIVNESTITDHNSTLLLIQTDKYNTQTEKRKL